MNGPLLAMICNLLFRLGLIAGAIILALNAHPLMAVALIVALFLTLD